MFQDVLFWALWIGSAVIAAVLVSEALALAAFYSFMRPFKSSLQQLAHAPVRISSSIKELTSESRLQLNKVSDECKSLTQDVVRIKNRTQDTWDDLSSAVERIKHRAEIHSRRTRRKTW